MDQIIETLENTLELIDELGNTRYCVTGEMHPDQRGIVEQLTALIDKFKDAKLESKLELHHAERQSIAQLVEDPSSGETLADPPATKEDDLAKVSDKWNEKNEKAIEALVEGLKEGITDCSAGEVIDHYDNGMGIDLTQPGAKEVVLNAAEGIDNKKVGYPGISYPGISYPRSDSESDSESDCTSDGDSDDGYRPRCRKCGRTQDKCNNFYYPVDWPM